MHGATFWQRDSAEALSRTFIDIMLFDRLEADQADAARNLQIRGERPISAKNVTETMVISGKADYVLGYNHPTDSGKPGFESCSVVVEAKERNTFHEGLAQTVAYMVGVQQDRRKLRRIVDTVYGVLADGTSWQFLRLDGKRLLISESYDSLVERNHPHKPIYRLGYKSCSFVVTSYYPKPTVPLHKDRKGRGTDFWEGNCEDL